MHFVEYLFPILVLISIATLVTLSYKQQKIKAK